MQGGKLAARPPYRMHSVFLVVTLVVSLRTAGIAARPVIGAVGVPTPPATYYGQVTDGPGFTPTAGMPVSAWIDGRLCGQSVTMDQQGEMVYAVDVVGEGPGGVDGCGAPGRVVVFRIATQFMAPTPAWDNGQLHDLPLQPMRPPSTPAVSIQRSGEDLVLSWPAVTLDTAGRATLVTSYRIWRSPQPHFDPALPPCACTHIATVAGLTYTDTDADGVDVVGDVNANYAYIVKAENAVGESATAHGVGEFDFTLVPGTQ